MDLFIGGEYCIVASAIRTYRGRKVTGLGREWAWTPSEPGVGGPLAVTLMRHIWGDQSPSIVASACLSVPGRNAPKRYSPDTRGSQAPLTAQVKDTKEARRRVQNHAR